MTRIVKSRRDWRDKAVARNRTIRTLTKRLERQVALNQAHEARQASLQELPSETDRAQRAAVCPAVQITDAQLARVLCVMLAIVGVVSFRSVPRIMRIFSAVTGVRLPWIPHFTSVINWTLRVGLAQLAAVGAIPEPWIAIIDASIDVSIKKALVVLRVKLSTLGEKGAALCLDDCECIGVEVADTWRGQTVSEALGRVFTASGLPVAILKDGGTDLNLGVKLWREGHDAKHVAVIEDVGHMAANALKAAYGKKTAFERFLASIKAGGAKLRQSDLAYLTPPKVRTKGRFQSIMNVAAWGERILSLLGGSGRQSEGSIADRLRTFLPGFGTHRTFLEDFAEAAGIVSAVLAILKNQGLNQATFRAARELLETLPERSKVRRRLTVWLHKHLRIQSRLGIGQTPLVVSSDVIETLMGKFKVILQRNAKAEFNRIVLAFPCLCGSLDQAKIDNGLRSVSHKQLLQWEKTHVIDSQAKKRRRALADVEVLKSVRPLGAKTG